MSEPIGGAGHRLFVYGTLAPDEENGHLLADLSGTWECASVRGHRHETGWGCTQGYPGLVLDEAGVRIAGHLFSSVELERCWPQLDAFEGEEYRRVATHVTTAEGRHVKAWVYVVRELS